MTVEGAQGMTVRGATGMTEGVGLVGRMLAAWRGVGGAHVGGVAWGWWGACWWRGVGLVLVRGLPPPT